MKWTVIGYWGGYPAEKSATSGYLLECGGFRLLVDCGSGVLAQLQSFSGIRELDAVLVSHYHHDHVADIGPLQFARLVESYTTGPLPVLPIYGHREDEDGFARLSYKTYTQGQAYDPNGILSIGPFSVSFMKTKHPVDCYAMKITDGRDSIVYTADSAYLPGFAKFAEGADLLVCESNFYAGQDASAAGHMTCTEAASIASDAGVGRLLLTHLPHFGNHEELVRQAREIYNGDVQLAYTGWTWGR
ncbi:MAG TPA: MBL fold metallo-hydrolase [Bacillales bacterium]|nr:MBL fold metallo-hydrolase [Bacillales bacterium]